MKLWHDDERPPPDDSWHVARTNADALVFLATGEVEEADLDFVLANFHENGLMLVEAMIARGYVPPKVNIHTSSGRAAMEMATALREAGYQNVTTKAAALCGRE